MPIIKAYDGTGNPPNHVRIFSNALLIQPVNDVIKCRAFSQTLSGMAQRWYSHLPPNSIGSFKDLSQAFIKKFISSRVHEKCSASLMGIVQGTKESLRDYLNPFTKEALKVLDLDDKLQDRARKYIKVEESMKKRIVNNEPAGRKKRKTDQEYSAKENPRVNKEAKSSPKKGGRGQKFTEYARLNAPRSQILMEIERDKDVRWPNPLKADHAKLDKRKLSNYTRDGERNNNGRRKFDDRRRDQDDQGRNSQPRRPVINMIFGGPTAADTFKNSRKAYAREVMHIVGEAPKRAKTGVTMSFDDFDLEGVKFPHDDPLVITPIIGNIPLKRVLVDNGGINGHFAL
ncbi:uncharacterized protein LOC141719464 [Apium graveolens]|uniref:uncharacterized protein LOC141719464 n=1 Tax=Apium graveolens TaxID=4045 RepID=UPI003D79A154